jgi:hypothetical protein
LADLGLVGDKNRKMLGYSGSQASLLGEFPPGKFFGIRILPVRQGTLRKLLRPAGTTLLNKMKFIALNRNDEREIWFLDVGVDAPRSIGPLDHVFT